MVSGSRRLPSRNALDEVRRLVDRRAIGAVEGNLDRLGLEPDLGEHVLELGALPARAAHGAIAPFDAGDMRLRQAAPVARTLVDRNQLGRRHRLQIGERDLGLTVGAVAADGNLVTFGLHLRNIGEVVAHEELVVGRDWRAEIFERRFVVRRPVGQLNERLLAGQRAHRDVACDAVGNAGRQFGCGSGFREFAGAGNGKRGARARRRQKMATCNHRLPPSRFSRRRSGHHRPAFRYSSMNMIRRFFRRSIAFVRRATEFDAALQRKSLA